DRLDSLVTRYRAAWRNDCIELWFDPDNRRTSFAHLVATSDGRIEAARTVQDRWGEGERDEAWRPAVECRTGRGPGAWTVELAVDLADLGNPGRSPVWGFDVARERKPGNGENSVWSTGGFNAAGYFGEVFFVPAEVSLAGGTLRNRGPEPVAARVEILVSAPRPADGYGTWEDRWTDLARETRALEVPPAAGGVPGQAPLLGADLARRVPAGGRVRITLVEPGPLQFEEFIANPVEGAD
ncbi:MAG: hypothetical protein ABIL09_26215, partial [Gemmatimonadota bacterium]